MTGQKVVDDVKTAFRFLEEKRGLLCARAEYDPKSFGNVIVEYTGEDLFVRVVKDRGQFSFSAGPSEATALTDAQLLTLAGAEEEFHALAVARVSVGRLGTLLEKNLLAIEAGLRTDAAAELVRRQLAHAQKLRDLIAQRKR